MPHRHRVLITGDSIAGGATAWWLGTHGCDVTVVEKAQAFRDGGANVDVRGAGRDVLRRMGLEDAALGLNTGEQGTAWLDERGRTVAEIPKGEGDSDGATAEMEILRGDLARLLCDAASKRSRFRYGDHIAALAQDADGVDVTFASGKRDRYDVVIVAEGVGSSTRELVLPGENSPRWMDMSIGYFTIPKQPQDRPWWLWQHETDGRSLSLRPDPHGTTRAMLSLQKPTDGEEDWSPARQKALLRERFADAGWEVPRVLKSMTRARDFHFEVLRQVRMPRWTIGRVVLTGDAAWCATPLAGIGATLALIGAYVLAGELVKQKNVTKALAAYETKLRPFVTKRQNVPKLGPRLMNPHSWLGLRLLHAALRVATQPAVRKVAGKLLARGPQDFVLPRYAALRKC